MNTQTLIAFLDLQLLCANANIKDYLNSNIVQIEGFINFIKLFQTLSSRFHNFVTCNTQCAVQSVAILASQADASGHLVFSYRPAPHRHCSNPAVHTVTVLC